MITTGTPKLNRIVIIRFIVVEVVFSMDSGIGLLFNKRVAKGNEFK